MQDAPRTAGSFASGRTLMHRTHQGKSVRLWLAVAASSLLYAGAHPPWSWWPLALLATAPVSAVLLDPRRRTGSLRAALAGLLFGAATTWLMVAHWSLLAAGQFFAGSAIAAWGFTAALPLIASGVAVYYALAFALVARLSGLGAMAGVVGSAALWSAAELARSCLWYGNPWGSFAAALAAADAAMPVAGLLSVGGAPAVALLAAAVGAAVGLAWAQRQDAVARGRALATGAAVAAALAGVSYAGEVFAPAREVRAGALEPLRVALVQAGIGKSRLWQSAGAAESFDRHLQLTRSFDTGAADLIVWSENALPFLLDANVDKREAVRALARERGAALLVGGSRSSATGDGRSAVFNSAFLFPADGSDPFVYDKRVLLPFIEHVPAWADPFLASPWQGAFAAGTSHGMFPVKGWRVAPLLCLEAIYPGDAAARAMGGADLFVNLSNDSWFDEGAGLEQHFSLAALLAAETRRPLVRVSTTGVSALVADDGLVSWRLPVHAAAVALIDVPPPARDSLFVRGGRTGFALLVMAIAFAAAVLPSWARRPY